MDINIHSNKHILRKAKELNLYDKLVFQLQKDFDRSNIDIIFSHSQIMPSPEMLTSQLREKIYFLLMERFSDYLNLLYVIDIPESSFKNLKVTDAVEVADQVTFLILKREWQKVWYKTQYS